MVGKLKQPRGGKRQRLGIDYQGYYALLDRNSIWKTMVLDRLEKESSAIIQRLSELQKNPKLPPTKVKGPEAEALKRRMRFIMRETMRIVGHSKKVANLPLK